MSEYLATPRATSAPFEPIVVALSAATTRTVLQVNVPAAQDIRVIGWGMSFDGASGTAIPVICHLGEGSVAATTGTSLTPELWGNPGATASVCIGGAALTAHSLTVEGTLSAFRMLDSQHVHPQSSYGVYFPEVRIQPRVAGAAAAATFLRIRCKAAASVNVIPWILWAEPAI